MPSSLRHLAPALLLLAASLGGALKAASGQDIIPAHPDAPGGGNPFQGLGRPDDPAPSRIQDYLPKSISDTIMQAVQKGDLSSLNDLNGKSSSLLESPSGTGLSSDPSQPSTPLDQTGTLPPSDASPSPLDTPPGAALNADPSLNGSFVSAPGAGGRAQEQIPPAAPSGLFSTGFGGGGAGLALPDSAPPNSNADQEPDAGPQAKPTNSNGQASLSLRRPPDPMVKEALREIKQGRYRSALDHLDNLSKLYPQAPELDYLKGIASVMNHDFAQAKVFYQKVLESNAPLELKDLAKRGLAKLE
ncbi:MAG: hypothetical protein K2Y32_07330 [Candidatus Obscuribacterales bacterium]|nr:hypothetical protein [Candidatus Obscuribacterales bacterium]